MLRKTGSAAFRGPRRTLTADLTNYCAFARLFERTGAKADAEVVSPLGGERSY